MIIIYENKMEHEQIRKIVDYSKLIHSVPFNNAYYINSYVNGTYKTADLVIKYIEQNKRK